MTRSTARGGSAALAWLLAFTALLGLASAEEARVLIYPPSRAGPLLEEALIRIGGELRAVGLRVELRSDQTGAPEGFVQLGEGDYGAIVLSQHGTRIDVRAYAPGLETPVSQSAHTHYPGTDAEVVAVRAVEALRAAMIQYARRQQEDAASLPEAVSDFTRLSPPPAAKPPGPPSEPEPTPPPLRTSPPAGTERSPWSLWLGPQAALELPAARGLFGIQGALWWRPSWLRLGLSGSETLAGGQFDQPEGTVELRRAAVQAHCAAEVVLSERSFAFLGLGAGWVHYRARTSPAPGYSALSTSHGSPALSLRLGGGHWFTPALGAYGMLGTEVLTNSPRLRFDGRDIAAAGRPTATLGAGLMLSL